MYSISRNEELSTNRMSKILNDFQTSQLPILQKYYDYYMGKHNILRKKPTDIGKTVQKIVVNYARNIENNFQGYLLGNPIQYSNEDEMFNEVLDILKYNDVHQTDNLYLRNALIYGIAYNINWIDEEGKQRFKILDSRECIPIYSDDLEQTLLYVIRFWKVTETNTDFKYYIELYTPNSVKHYKSNAGFKSFSLIDETPHYYQQCPITVFTLNDEEESIFGQVMTLNDAYNSILSDECDSIDQWADCYMKLTGVTADEETLKKMKQSKVLLLPKDANADYLIKNSSDTQIVNVLNNINDLIHKISCSPDFNDDKFMAQSGIALKFKLISFTNIASNIEANMKKALQRRLELISAIMNLSEDTQENIWRDAKFTFNYNIPTDYTDVFNLVSNLSGIVSTPTLLSNIPIVDNVDEEMERIATEKQLNADLYSFNLDFNNEEEINDQE